MNTLLFVYGTLKRGCSNHHQLASQTFVGAARTIPGFSLFDLGGYPGIAAKPDDRAGVVGEVWSVDAAALEELDRFEGVHEGLYRRGSIGLMPPFDTKNVEAYLPSNPIIGRKDLGDYWQE
jgi:gamma-glutamylcyclotransferase (GGCT)/AIG2-like uncharacterized protein YtfP